MGEARGMSERPWKQFPWGKSLLLFFLKSSLRDSLEPASPAASCVDQTLSWETEHVESNGRPATHPVQPWASHFPSLGLTFSICKEGT